MTTLWGPTYSGIYKQLPQTPVQGHPADRKNFSLSLQLHDPQHIRNSQTSYKRKCFQILLRFRPLKGNILRYYFAGNSQNSISIHCVVF